MPVAFDIMAGYPVGRIDAEGGTVTVKGTVPWSDVGNKLDELFPASTTSGIGANAIDPLFGLYRCQSCEFEPLGSNGAKVNYGTPFNSPYDATFKLPIYELAVLTAVYSSVQVEFPNASSGDGGGAPDTPDGSTEVTGLIHQLTSGGETIKLQDSSLYWSDDLSAKESGLTCVKIIPTIEHNVTWKRVISPPWESMRTLIGKVNNVDLGPFQTGTMLEETLMYLGFTATPDITPDGQRVWEIGYRFSERRIDELSKSAVGGSKVADGINVSNPNTGGWNHFYKQEEPDKAGGANTKTSGFRRLHATKPVSSPLLYNADTAIHQKADLTALFVQV